MKTLAERTKKRRIELGLTQDELAKRMGYSSRSSINKIENGRPITQKIILRLADALSTTPEYLMGWATNECTTTKEAPISKNVEKWNEEIGCPHFNDNELHELIEFAKFLLSKRK